MTTEQFVIWLRGFAKAANPYNITPKQWEDLTEQLEKVNQKEIHLINEETDKIF